MTVRWLAAWALGAALAGSAGTARAEGGFEDCQGQSFFHAISDGLPMPGFDCEELDRRSFTANGQAFEVRVLKDKKTDLQQVQQYAGEILNAAEQSYAVYGGLDASLKFRNVSIVIMDPNLPWPTKALGIAVKSAQGECAVRMFSVATDNFPYGGAPLFQQTVAHELFHCVQYATYPKETDLESSVWWLEATAELASHLVYPLPQRMQAIAWGFEKLTKTRPLTQLTYEAVVFMDWLYGRDPSKLFELMAAMPDEDDGEEAQQRAFLGFIGEEDLQQFARDWVDGKIPMPSGGMLAAPKPPPTSLQVEDDTEMTLNGPVLAMQLDAVSIRKGEYMPLEFDGGAISVYQRKRDEQAWDRLPEQIGPDDCKGSDERLLVRMPTEESNAKLRVQFKKTKPCEECVNSDVRDKCLVGKWQMDAATLLTFLRNKDDSDSEFQWVDGTLVLVYEANGDTHLVAEGLEISGSQKADPYPESSVKVEMNGVDAGTWSAESGQITYCPKESSIDYKTTIEVPGVTRSERTIEGVMQTSIFSYQCSGETLDMTYAGPLELGADAPRWHFTRIK